MTILFDNTGQAPQPEPHHFDAAEGWLSDLEYHEIIVSPVAYGMQPFPGRASTFAAYRSFRELVYVTEDGIIDLRDGEMATDFDQDDHRSIHLAAVERTREGGRIVGSMRLILSGVAAPPGLEDLGLEMSRDALPVEVEFADAIPAVIDLRESVVMCELSRYISRHESKSRKMMISRSLHQVAVATVVHNKIGSTYAVVEHWLDRILRMSRVPLTKLSDPRWLEKYGSENYAVEIHMYELAERLGSVMESVVLEIPRARAS